MARSKLSMTGRILLIISADPVFSISIRSSCDLRMMFCMSAIHLRYFSLMSWYFCSSSSCFFLVILFKKF